MILQCIGILIFGSMAVAGVVFFLTAPKPMPDVMDGWVANRLGGPAPIPDRWPGEDELAMDRMGPLIEEAFKRSGLCQCGDCQTRVDEDYCT